MKKKSVNVGKVKGETPRKIFYFSKNEAPNEIESATPERVFFADAPLKGLLRPSSYPDCDEAKTRDKYSSPSLYERPSTSRGKKKPTPDEFADYVGPSPERTLKTSESPLQGKVLLFEDETSEEVKSSTEPEVQKYSKTDEIVAVGCWLFGSALAV